MKSVLAYPSLNQQSQAVLAARQGDICLQLVPAYSESAAIRSRLAALQLRYGGEAHVPLHLSCQRFHATGAQLEQLRPRLRKLTSQQVPLLVTAEQVEPFYSTFHEQELLKCRVTVSREISAFVQNLNQVLDDLAIPTHYPWTPDLVTLLAGIKVSRLKSEAYASPLFLGQRLLLSRVKAPGHWAALESFALGC